MLSAHFFLQEPLLPALVPGTRTKPFQQLVFLDVFALAIKQSTQEERLWFHTEFDRIPARSEEKQPFQVSSIGSICEHRNARATRHAIADFYPQL